jgi:hypothetical protein
MADENVGLRLDVDGAERYTEAGKRVDQLNQSLKQVESTGHMAGRGFNNFGMSVLYVSQTIEDLQYGFRAILNNIPLLVMSMGGGPGLAGAISLVTVAGSQLYQHWDKLAQLFGEGATENEADRMKRLADESKRAATEIEKANRAVANPGKKEFSEKFARDVGAVGGSAVVLEAISAGQTTAGGRGFMAEQLNRALAGDAGAIQFIMDNLIRKRPDLAAGIITSAEKHGPIAATKKAFQESMKSDAQTARTERIADLIAGNDQSLGLGNRVDKLREALKELNKAFARGEVGGEAYKQTLKTINDGIEKLTEAERKLVEKRQEELRKREQAENTETGERLSGRAAGIYGQAFGGNVMRAMMAASGRGEGDDAVNERLQTQLEARMMRLPPSLRSMAARQIIEQARMMQQDMAIQQAAGGDINVANMSASMAPPNTAMGRFQRSMLARQTLIGGQAAGRQLGMLEQADGRIPNWTGKMDQTADKFGMAVDRLLTRGIQITL